MKRHCYEIWTNDENTDDRIVLTQNQEHMPENSLTVECEIPNYTWYVDIVPKEGWISILDNGLLLLYQPS